MISDETVKLVDQQLKDMKQFTIINYADFTNEKDITNLCKTGEVIFDFKLWDIPTTMRRNVKKCAKLGGYAVTVSDHSLNYEGISVAKEAGKKYGIQIIVGNIK